MRFVPSSFYSFAVLFCCLLGFRVRPDKVDSDRSIFENVSILYALLAMTYFFCFLPFWAWVLFSKFSLCVKICLADFRFSMTHIPAIGKLNPTYFNSRAREGRDRNLYVEFCPQFPISTHAPARGATCSFSTSYL